MERRGTVFVRVVPMRSRSLAHNIRAAFLVSRQLEKVWKSARDVLRPHALMDLALIGVPELVGHGTFSGYGLRLRRFVDSFDQRFLGGLVVRRHLIPRLRNFAGLK